MQLKYETRQIGTDNGILKMTVVRPCRQTRRLPGLMWIHGGGYFLGGSYMVRFSRAKDIARQLGAVVVSPDYRLAGNAPYPAALEDCYAALAYMFDHADGLGMDKSHISVGGESAGGGLTAALCMLARDKGAYRIRSQLPLYPMIDCEDTDSSRDNHAHAWNTKRNHFGWKKYLAGLDPSRPIPPYASPSRQTLYHDLPPAYTFVCDGEPFYCETLTYIRNLQSAGVDAAVDVYHANTHSFDMLCPWLKVSREAKQNLIKRAAQLL